MMERGELAAGMPIEFAFMVLGRPPSEHNPSPLITNILNPVTGNAETFTTYTWVDLGGGGVLRTVFGMVGVAALGVAGTTSSLNTAVNALTVANLATTAELALTLSALSRASVVTVQVGSDNQIRMLTMR